MALWSVQVKYFISACLNSLICCTQVIEALNKTLEIRLQEDWDYQSLVDATPSPKMSETDALIVAYNCGQFNNKRLIRKVSTCTRYSFFLVPGFDGFLVPRFDGFLVPGLMVS